MRDRLPLLAGGELSGPDRRKVERHLITCPGCGDHERSLAGALAALHAAGSEAPPSGAPSLWPALRQQIREAKHGARPLPLPGYGPSWHDLLAALVPPRPRPRTAFVLAGVLALAALTAAGLSSRARRQVDAARAETVAADRPPGPVPADLEPPALPGPDDPGAVVGVARADAAPDPNRAASRIDYDLDRGTPMGDGGDVKATY